MRAGAGTASIRETDPSAVGRTPSTDVDISYHPRLRVGGVRIGAHRSRAVGSLGTFRDQVPFMSYPDARRIDIRATLRDPFENTFVRRFHQRVAIDVFVLADLTGSLDYEGEARKKDLIVAVAAALARSATRIGDRFGLFGCDERLRGDCTIYPTKRPGIVPTVVAKLQDSVCTGASAAGLLDAAAHIGGSGKMVFVVSDFLLPLDLLRRLFERLAQHDIVPVLIADSTEDLELPDWGFVELADLETGHRKLVFMRPTLKTAWMQAQAQRNEAFRMLAQQFGRSPIVVKDRFDADDFSRQLAES